MNRFAGSQHGRKTHALLRSALMPAVLCALLLLFLGSGIASVSRTAEQEQLKSTRQAVARAAAHCYASEGMYPPSLTVLEQRYGLQLNHDKYIIDYQYFASNMMPDITVIPKKKPHQSAEMGALEQ